MKTLNKLTLAALAALLAAAAQAATPAVPLLNGGYGHEDQQRIEHLGRAYNLHLVFSAGRHDAYASGVHLRVLDAHGKPVATLADAGPLTDLKLPPGMYRIDARYGGIARTARVDVKAGMPTDLYLHWAHEPHAT